MKKITILLPFFLDGGVERVMLNLSNGFIENGFSVDFVFISNSKGPLVKEISKECRIFELNKKGTISALLPFLRYIKKEKPDVILAALTPANLLSIFAKIICFKKIKVFIEIQIAVRTHISTSFLKSKFRPFIYKIFFRFADKVVAASKGIEEDLKYFGVKSSKIVVIYNPVSSTYTDKMGNEKNEHPWFSNKEIPVILAVGRLHKQKDFPVLLEAFSKVLVKKEARLIILGEGEERKNLEEIIIKLNIKEKVDLFGFTNNPYSFMKNAPLFVLSSGWEGFGNVVAEALSFGTPVVSTNCPWGPSEILENGKYGRLVPVGDSGALANAIIESLINKHSPELELEGAKRFKTEVVLAQYLDLIK